MEGAGTSDGGDEADFTSWRVRDLKGFLAERGVSGYGVLERSELETLCEQASRGVLEGRCVRRLLTCGAPRAQRPLVCRAPVLRASLTAPSTRFLCPKGRGQSRAVTGAALESARRWQQQWRQ